MAFSASTSARSRKAQARARARRAGRAASRRRSVRVARPLGLARGTVHRFAKCLSTPLSIINTTTVFSVEVTLAAMQGYADITALFDQYRITGWEITFLPTRNVAEASGGLAGDGTYGTAPNGNIPQIWLCNDQDGGGPTTAANFYERPDARVFMLDKPVVWKCKNPRISQAAFSGGAFAGYSVASKSVWVDCASTAVPYYGTYGLQTYGTQQNGYIMGYVKVFIEAKGIH